MNSKFIAGGLVFAAIALLLALVYQSRPIKINAHVDHHAVLAELERVQSDFDALLAQMNTSHAENQVPAEGTASLAQHFAKTPARLSDRLYTIPGSRSRVNRVRNNYTGLERAVTTAAVLANNVIKEQSGCALAVQHLRDTGPVIVQQMRDLKLDRAANDIFSLVMGALDYTRTGARAKESELWRLGVTLTRDQRIDANIPGEVRELRTAVETIIRSKPSLQSKLDQLADSPIASNAGWLADAQRDIYSAALASVAQARTFLSIYAIALLLAAGYVTFRLNQSYRVLNRANNELERRVEERTRELSQAYVDLKESHVQLVQAEKMSSLGQLVAGISHEINTPLLYLTNNVALIKERLALSQEFVKRCMAAFAITPQSQPDRATYQIKFVEALKGLKLFLQKHDVEEELVDAAGLATDSAEGLDELARLAQSLKDFSRLDRAPVDTFDVNEGLEKTLLIAKNALKYKATINRSFGELPGIECSPSQINQVFLNLVTNAAQAIEDRGEISITTARHGDTHVSIKIADTGCGIATEHLGNIRDPFFTTKEVGEGTGLGLSIVDEIVRSHHGELLVESEPGQGSVFSVVLPIRQPEAEPEEEPAVEPEPIAEAV